jgi:DNA polymerase-3 subunit beta
MSSIDTVASVVLKAVCSKDELAQMLGVVSRGVSTRTSVQILAGIKLQIEEGQLGLSATDMEISLRASVTAQVEGDGAVVVPGRLFVDIVRLLPAADVELEYRSEQGQIHVSSGAASYDIHTFNAEDFPRLPEVAQVSTFRVERAAFLDTIARVSRSASRDESRPVLTGVLVRFEQGKVMMAATDSYRLSVKETELEESPEGEIEAIVPGRALAELQRICQGSAAETIEVGVQENQVVFGVDGLLLTARRIDGQFPNYKQLLPESFEAEIHLPRQEFLDIVRRMSLMVQRNSPLRLRFEEGQLTVSAQTQDVGEARESMPVGYTGDAMEIGFNAEFLRDGLESVADESVRLRLISPLRPGMIHGESEDFQYLIMPIRLAG